MSNPQPYLSPLALPFNDALVSTKFVEHLAVSTEAEVKRHIWEQGNAALRPAVLGSKILLDQQGFRVVFERGIPRGAKLMQDRVGGRGLPVLVDGKTGRTLKQARAIGKAGRVGRAASTAALVIVETAHMISNHDNAKRLKRVERGIDRLLQAHDAELKGRLEAIYRYSKELLHTGLDTLTREDQRELHRLCRELIELRARWRDSFLYRLQQIDKADPGWINKLFFWRRAKAEHNARQRKADEGRAGLPDVQMMHFSLTLQMLLSAAAERMPEFRGSTLPEECLIWSKLQNVAESRAKEISGGNLKEFRPFLNAVGDMAAVWDTCAFSSSLSPLMNGRTSQLPDSDESRVAIPAEEESNDDFFIAYPERNGSKIGDDYILKVHFARRLGDNITRLDLVKQFIVRTHSKVSGVLDEGVTISHERYRVEYNASRDCHALAVPLPQLSNGLAEWLHVVEAELRRPEWPRISDPGSVFRAVRLVRA